MTTTRYVVRRPLLDLVRRVRRSPFADDVRAAVNAAFWPATAGAGLIVGLGLMVATRHTYMGWDGLHHIPTAGVAR